jgi:hypothetical protein
MIYFCVRHINYYESRLFGLNSEIKELENTIGRSAEETMELCVEFWYRREQTTRQAVLDARTTMQIKLVRQ